MRGPLGAVIGRYPSSDGDAQMVGIIRHNRKCRDIVFLILFIAFWIAMIVNSSLGFNQGNPLRLTYGLDYKGNVCGDRHADPDLRELELRYWVNPNQVYESGLKNGQFMLTDARSLCLMDCPIPSEDSLNWVCDYPEGDIHISMNDWIDRNYDYFEFLTPDMRNSSLQLQGPCYPVIFPSVNVIWTCQFIARASNMSLRHWQQMGGVNINEDIIIDKSIHKAINSRSAVLKRYVADIGKAWPVLIVCGGIVPLFLSVIWLLMIRHFVAGMTWITVIIFNFLIISVTMFYYLKAGWIGNDAISPIIGESDPYYNVSGREQNHLRAVSVLMTIVMAIAILSSIAIVRRILMATSVLKVAAKVIGEVQALIIFPIIPYTILAVVYMFWFSAALHLFSSGQIVQNDCNSKYCAYDLASKQVSCGHCGYGIHYTPHIEVAILFHLFGFYWATQFFIACSSTVIAGSVASYYWARGETSPEIPFLPVFSSMKRLMRYSLGSVAIDSLIVSFVESVRYILESIRRRLKVANTTPESYIGKPEIPFLPVFSSMKRLMRYSLGSVAIDSLIVSFVESVRYILESIRRRLKVANTTPESYIGKPEIPFLPVFSSMKRLMRYSLGSVAIGSLIVSFVESVRYILESIRRRLKVANTTPESYIGKVGFHSSQSCRGCIEWTVKSVNRNAYIMIAIMGTGFFRASSIATGLIMNNILRIGRVNVIGDVILFLGKLCVSLSSAVFAFLMLDTHKYRSAHNKISSPLFPVLVCWWLGYVVATLFFAVVEMSIDTIILSFCQDSEEHQGTAQYAPPLLIETLNDQNEMQRLTQGSS